MGATTALQWVHLCIVTCVIVFAQVLQGAVRIFYRFFPAPALLDELYTRSRMVRQAFAFRLSSRSPGPTQAATPSSSSSARELITRAGFGVEEHAAETADGFVLGLQRVLPGTHARAHSRVRSESDPLAHRDAAFEQTSRGLQDGRMHGHAHSAATSFRPPVLLMHGLMQCSDAWLVGGRGHALPFVLADAGFDVWLGNNRGNKYSGKHTRLSPHSDEYWNFCIDDLARFDVPRLVEYVLAYTGAPRLAYIGFSQGTAQCFAALAARPELNDKLSVFIALSPAVAIRGLAKSPLTALVESDLSFVYTLFGRQRMLPVTLNVQSVLSGSAWVGLLDACLMYLFRWRMAQVDAVFKHEAYHHIYSFASVKTVVHWFQILSTGRFAMFSDARSTSMWGFLSSLVSQAVEAHTVPPLYDVSKISVPMALFAGEADTLIDIPRLVDLLPRHSKPVPMPCTRPQHLTSRRLSDYFAPAAHSTAVGPRSVRAVDGDSRPHRMLPRGASSTAVPPDAEFQQDLRSRLQAAAGEQRVHTGSTVDDSIAHRGHHAHVSPAARSRRRAGRLRLDGDAASTSPPSAPVRSAQLSSTVIGAFNAAVDTLVGGGNADVPDHHDSLRSSGSIIDLQELAADGERRQDNRRLRSSRGAASMPLQSDADPVATDDVLPDDSGDEWKMEAQPLHVFVEPDYEHLDFKWAASCRLRTYPAIVFLLQKYQHLQLPYSHTPGIPADDFVKPTAQGVVPAKSAPYGAAVTRASMDKPPRITRIVHAPGRRPLVLRTDTSSLRDAPTDASSRRASTTASEGASSTQASQFREPRSEIAQSVAEEPRTPSSCATAPASNPLVTQLLGRSPPRPAAAPTDAASVLNMMLLLGMLSPSRRHGDDDEEDSSSER